jgi:hypothetical protein
MIFKFNENIPKIRKSGGCFRIPPLCLLFKTHLDVELDLLPPQPVAIVAIIATHKSALTIFFFIKFSFSFSPVVSLLY